MAISEHILDEILKELKNPLDMDADGGLFDQLKKGLMERALEAEMTHHLGYSKNDPAGNNSGNSRNGKTKKTIKTKDSQLEIEIPRDRQASYDPILVGKWQRRFPGFDNKIIALYSRGLSTREIQAYLEDIYQMDVSPALISMVTDAVIQEVEEWRSRQLSDLYPIVYFDALMVSVRDNGFVRKKAVYLALGVNKEGQKELLGMWMHETEGAKFWLSVMNELHNRGLKDIFIACADGLKGFDAALESVYPKTMLQLCIVHTIRNSLKFVSYKERKEMADDLKKVYTSATADEAELRLLEFREKWDSKYPMAGKSWESNWAKITPFFAFPDYIRKAIYTTNAIESLNMTLRKILKTRAAFPNDEAAFKLIYLGIRNISRKWTMPIREWGMAWNQFMIIFGDRMS
jgi:putative transposase